MLLPARFDQRELNIVHYQAATFRPLIAKQQKPYRVGIWVVPLLIVSAMFQNYFDLLSVMSGESLKLYQAQGPLAIRALKDMTYIFIIFALIYFIYSSRNNVSIAFLLIFTVAICLFALSIGKHNLITAALGLRWITPLLIFMLMKDWAGHFDGRAVIGWVYGGMLICAALQIYQLFNMPPIYGTIFGLSARTPGIFLAPNTASFFGCTGAAFIITFSGGNFRHKVASASLALVISSLAQSGTGVVVSAFLILHIFLARSQAVLFIAAGLAMLWVIPNLDTLLLRDGFTELSGGGRIDRFSEIVSESAFSLNNFGFYTNAANLADAMSQYRRAVDSLIASFIGNFGATTAFVLAALIFFILENFKGARLSNFVPILSVFVVFSFSTIVFEAYPMNILIALSFWGAKNLSFEKRGQGIA